MAIAYGGTTNYTYQSGGTLTSYSFSATTSGTDRVMAVFIGLNNTSSAPSSVTFNGVSLTKLGDQAYDSKNSSIWYLLSPATSSSTLAITLPSASYIQVSAAYFTGANALQNLIGKNDITNSLSITVTSSVNNMIFDGWIETVTQSSITPGGGQTAIRSNAGEGNGGVGVSYKASSATSTTMTWSNTSSGFVPHIACEVVAGAQAPASTPNFLMFMG